eukprot:TRINITY_DN36092_c0_g1_i1.p1 TRINITY_DN36092_c0_g1~~TRINITY_DN36092_c0_g1_i1.p1  ORF type:complete len:160 (-),score=29.04 TRINITY_DN36092_c0_g1_i1:284-763(-)
MSFASGVRRLLAEAGNRAGSLRPSSPFVSSLGASRSLNLDLPPVPEKEKDPPNTKLFVSGLNKNTTDEGLRNKFSEFGRLLEARVVTDRVSGRSRGFGFVRYGTLEEAIRAKEAMDGKFLDGWVIFADYAKPRSPKPPPPPEEPNPCGLNIQKTVGWCG